MSDTLLQQLCDELRDAQGSAEIERAAQALRSHLKEQQSGIRERLLSEAEKAFQSQVDLQDQHED